jgi:hypothetical protein
VAIHTNDCDLVSWALGAGFVVNSYEPGDGVTTSAFSWSTLERLIEGVRVVLFVKQGGWR